MDLPIVFDLDIALKGEGDMPYRCDDNYGARLGVLRRDDPFGEIRSFDIDVLCLPRRQRLRPRTANRLCCRQLGTPNCGVTTVVSTPTR